MAAAWQEWQAEWTAQQKPAIPEAWLGRLIAAEQADRKARIEQLATAGFMAQGNNLILVGGTGTGKTHLAIALGVSAIHLEKRMRFYNAVDLVNQLEKEKQLGRAGSLGDSGDTKLS